MPSSQAVSGAGQLMGFELHPTWLCPAVRAAYTWITSLKGAVFLGKYLSCDELYPGLPTTEASLVEANPTGFESFRADQEQVG